jgi:hypothetical protein
LTQCGIGAAAPSAYFLHMKKLRRRIRQPQLGADPEQEARLRCEEAKAEENRAEAERGEAMSPEGLREFMEALERGDVVPSFPRRR